MKKVVEFLQDDGGTETFEQAILAGLVAIGLVGVIALIAAWAKSRFDGLNDQLPKN